MRRFMTLRQGGVEALYDGLQGCKQGRAGSRDADAPGCAIEKPRPDDRLEPPNTLADRRLTHIQSVRRLGEA
jgi:hypothetical protein